MLVLRSIKRVVAAGMAGLAIQPAARAALPDPIPRLGDASDPVSADELNIIYRASFHPELTSRYEGPRTGVREQLIALERVKGTPRYNACFAGSGQAEAFIADRTR